MKAHSIVVSPPLSIATPGFVLLLTGNYTQDKCLSGIELVQFDQVMGVPELLNRAEQAYEYAKSTNDNKVRATPIRTVIDSTFWATAKSAVSDHPLNIDAFYCISNGRQSIKADGDYLSIGRLYLLDKLRDLYHRLEEINLPDTFNENYPNVIPRDRLKKAIVETQRKPRKQEDDALLIENADVDEQIVMALALGVTELAEVVRIPMSHEQNRRFKERTRDNAKAYTC